MRYGIHFDLHRLPPEGRNLLEVLIARELTAPSRGTSMRGGTLYGLAPDHPHVIEMARNVAYRPEGGYLAAMRADCIHAVFGVLEYIATNRPPARTADELIRAQGPEREDR